MRFVVVGPVFPFKGGVAQHTTMLVRRLVSRGHEVSVETWRHQYPDLLYPGRQRLDEPEAGELADVHADLSWARPDAWWRVGTRAGRRADVVVIAQISSVQLPALGVLALAARHAGARIVVICHNVLPHEQKPWDRAFTRAFFRIADALVVHSRDEEVLARSLGARQVGVATLPFFWPTAATPQSEGRADAVLFFGFVRPYKGLTVLLDAMALAADGPRLRVAGESWISQSDLEHQIAARGLADRVELSLNYLPVERVPDEFAAVDALIVPYVSGTGSQHPRLAHHFGVPVIATTVGDLSGQVRDGIDGLLVAPDDPSALARAIDSLYSAGVLERLRAGVRPPNPDEEWAQYLDVLEQSSRSCS